MPKLLSSSIRKLIFPVFTVKIDLSSQKDLVVHIDGAVISSCHKSVSHLYHSLKPVLYEVA